MVSAERVGGRYVDWLVPGLVGLQLMGGGLWGVGWVIVDARQRKLMKRMLATPMKRSPQPFLTMRPRTFQRRRSSYRERLTRP